jgi:hypothetical protein
MMAKVELVGAKEDFAPEVGDFFMEKEKQEIYILAQVSSDGYILICLSDGHRWVDVQESTSKIFGQGGEKGFVKIEAPFTVTPE